MHFHGSFGHWLRERRKVLDLTQAELAEQVFCSVMTIRKIERDERRPSKQMTERLADVLAISDTERADFVAYARRGINSSGLERSPHAGQPQAEPTRFIGRAAELAQIAANLSDANCRLLTLTGPGGIGKTRLAIHATGKHHAAFKHGVCLVSLTPVGSPALLATAIADVLKLAPGILDPRNQVINFLSDKQLLLVLDNFEHLLDASELLSDLLAQATGLKIVVTSRERLNLVEEWVLPIEGLSYPDKGDAEPIMQHEAVQLFEQSARRVQPRFTVAENRDCVVTLCQAVEGMPLALELAATWLRVMPCPQIAEQIGHNLDLLTTPMRNVSERHRNMRAVFDHSWHLLSEVEQHVLATLSVFRGGFDGDAAGSVAGASLPILAGLVDKSLIRLQPSGRYDLHELLRQYTAHKLNDYGQVEAQRRHFEYFLALAERAHPALQGGPDQLAWFERFEVEENNLRAALAWALDSDQANLALQFAVAMSGFWGGRHRYREAYQCLELALSKQADVAPALGAKAFCLASEMAAIFPGNYRQAGVFGEEALALSRASGEKGLIAQSLTRLGSIALNRGDPAEALRLIEEARELQREIGSKEGLIETLDKLGTVRRVMGHFDRAIAIHEEGLALAVELGWRIMAGWHLFGMSRTRLAQRNPEQAEVFCRECDLIFQELNDTGGQGHVSIQYGELARFRGANALAQRYYRHGLALLKQQEAISSIVFCLRRMGELALVQQLPTLAGRLLGVLAAYNQQTGYAPDLRHDVFYNANVVARGLINEVAFNRAYDEGLRITISEAAAYALGPT